MIRNALPVPCLAASAEGSPRPVEPLRQAADETRSAASAGNRFEFSLGPSVFDDDVSALDEPRFHSSPSRNALRRGGQKYSDDPLLRNPITGFDGCCACAASGHAAAAPPSSVMNSRRSSLDHLIGAGEQRRRHCRFRALWRS